MSLPPNVEHILKFKAAFIRKKRTGTGVTYSILSQVYRRGEKAYNNLKKPNVSKHFHAMLRVNSFLSHGHSWNILDKDLAEKVSTNSKNNIYKKYVGKFLKK
jgi:hypothetical protein